MRIGIFTDTYPPYVNGVSTSITMLEKGLRALGHEVFIITVNPTNYKYKFDKHIIRIPSVPINIYDYRIAGIYSMPAAAKIKKLNLDIIHSQTEFGIGTFARFMANELDIPIVHTYHTMYEDYKYYIFKGHFDKATDKLLKYFIEYYCDSSITELIVPTKKIEQLFCKKYHLKRDINIVPTGLETERFYKEQFSSKKIEQLKKKYKLENRVVTLFVGRLGDEKSVDKLIIAEKKIVASCPNHTLLIIGDGPDRKKYDSLVTENKLENHVIFTGGIPYKEIPIYYQLADMFATASTTETQGLTIVEAMAASLPVLAIKDDAFVEAINENNGHLFKNMNDYVKKTIELTNNPELRAQLGNQGRIDSDRYSVATFASSVEAVYKKAIRERGLKDHKFVTIAKDVVERGLHNE